MSEISDLLFLIHYWLQKFRTIIIREVNRRKENYLELS